MVVAMLLVFIVGFAMGAGPLVWILCAEIQPLKGRDFGIACSPFTNWAANWLVGNTFLTLLATLGQGGTFWLFAALNAAFVPFVLLYVLETRGVSLESIERRLLNAKVSLVPPPVSVWVFPSPATMMLTTPGCPLAVALSPSAPMTNCGASGVGEATSLEWRWVATKAFGWIAVVSVSRRIRSDNVVCLIWVISAGPKFWFR